MKASKLKVNPNNPRLIKDDKFEKLCKSLQDFPKMMELRPIVIDESDMILGGNMRFKALQHLGYKDIPDEWIKRADELTEDQKREFIIKDNVGFGLHDWDILANEWEQEELIEWGMDLPLDWGGDSEPEKDPFDDDGITADNKYGVIVMCKSAFEQEEVFSELQAKGYECKVVVV